MTDLVANICEDGIVIGADSSATSYAAQTATIEQPADKVFIVGDDVIVAGSGPVGLGQRFEAIVRQVRAIDQFLQTDHLSIAKSICAATINDFRSTFAGPGQFGALVAFPCRGQLYLCEFAGTDLQPEFKMGNTWFVSMGSGQLIADSFLRLMRRALFRHSRPKLNEAIFAVRWTLLQAIDLNPGGIKGPPQIGVLRRDPSGQHYVARLLTDGEIAEHQSNVDGAEDYLAKYREKLSGQSESTTMPPPALSSVGPNEAAS
jgi:20S proteasome alpha/beta subunit